MSSCLAAMDMTDGTPAAIVPGSTLVIILALKVLLSPEKKDYDKNLAPQATFKLLWKIFGKGYHMYMLTYTMYKYVYHRTVFNCKHLLIANCVFSYVPGP